MSAIGAKKYAELSRTRLSPNFILRDFLFSTDAAAAGHSNFPSDDADLVVKSGKQLCGQVLEPILAKFGRFAITFGYQARSMLDSPAQQADPKYDRESSQPHQWDRDTQGSDVYAHVDILPYCVEDRMVTKQEFAHWCMMNLDIDLLMQFPDSNVYCTTISPKPRRYWWEWTHRENGGTKIVHMGKSYWENEYPNLPLERQPKFHR